MYQLIAVFLIDLLKKEHDVTWTEPTQDAFDKLKKTLIKELVLKLSNHSKKFEIYTDVPNFTIWGMLMQDGHPIAYENGKLKNPEHRYFRYSLLSYLYVTDHVLPHGL